MKKYLEFNFVKRGPKNSPLNGWLIGHEFERLATRFPEFISRNGSCWDVKLLEDDPKLEEIFDFLTQELGLRPMLSRACRKKQKPGDYSHFTVETVYEFAEHDIESASFLRMSATAEYKRDRKSGLAAWRWEFDKPPQKPLPLIGYMETLSGVICTAAARAELEQEGFPGLDFLPITVDAPQYPDGVFWRLWANRIMPKVSMPLCDQEGNSVKDDYSTGCMRDEITVNQKTLKYKATDLALMSGTDFALTAERWGGPKDRDRREMLLVSQRFRQWCLKKGVKAEWTPVIALPE